ncbi:MAG: pseudouridine-5'-phosphate glycosidase, partial [Clostridia bacterium]
MNDLKLNKYLEISNEVKDALANGKPVVALESTIISHGMPYPKNVETALRVEQVVRENGAIPATIAIIDGKLKVGVTAEEIDYLGKKGLAVTKVSRRDIAVVLANNDDGATTVAATMIIANLAGIKVFATGGIGGVHRNAETTWDVSADLEELAQTPVMVVCAGAKSILDLGLTKEYLETKGVAILGYKTDELPAFFTRHSGFKLDKRVDDINEFAKIAKISQELGMKNGFVVANPIAEEFSMDKNLIDSVIENAVKEANQLGIKGKETTPFLLDKIQKLTGGDSLEANIQL